MESTCVLAYVLWRETSDQCRLRQQQLNEGESQHLERQAYLYLLHNTFNWDHFKKARWRTEPRLDIPSVYALPDEDLEECSWKKKIANNWEKGKMEKNTFHEESLKNKKKKQVTVISLRIKMCDMNFCIKSKISM